MLGLPEVSPGPASASGDAAAGTHPSQPDRRRATPSRQAPAWSWTADRRWSHRCHRRCRPRSAAAVGAAGATVGPAIRGPAGVAARRVRRAGRRGRGHEIGGRAATGHRGDEDAETEGRAAGDGVDRNAVLAGASRRARRCRRRVPIARHTVRALSASTNRLNCWSPGDRVGRSPAAPSYAPGAGFWAPRPPRWQHRARATTAAAVMVDQLRIRDHPEKGGYRTRPPLSQLTGQGFPGVNGRSVSDGGIIVYESVRWRNSGPRTASFHCGDGPPRSIAVGNAPHWRRRGLSNGAPASRSGVTCPASDRPLLCAARRAISSAG